MSGKQIGERVPAAIDVVIDFVYPATAFVEIISWPGGTVHDIRYAGAPAGLFANAPNGSHFIDTTNSDTYVKAGAVGSGIDGAWVQT
jgi:hypothetical protein